MTVIVPLSAISRCRCTWTRPSLGSFSFLLAAVTYCAALLAMGSPAIVGGMEVPVELYVGTELEVQWDIEPIYGSNSKVLTAGSCAAGCGHLPIRASLAKCDGGATKQPAMWPL